MYSTLIAALTAINLQP